MLQGRVSPAVAGSYLSGAAVGAALTSSLLLIVSGLLSPIPATLRVVGLLVGVAVLALRASGLLAVPLPQNRRQIPEHAFATKPTRAAFNFAFELGTAMRTYVTKEAPYAVALAMILAAPRTLGSAIVASVLLALGFGFGRSMIVTGQMWRRTVITGHPTWSLHAANVLTMVGVVIIALRLL